MLRKGQIVANALLLLGEVRNYNNNNYQIYQVAMDIIETIVNEIGSSPVYRANAIKSELTLVKKENNKFYYNKPSEMLSIVRGYTKYNELAPYEIEGEYITSNIEDLTILYCRPLPIEEYPGYYSDIFSYSLAEKLAEAFSQYNKKLDYIVSKKKQAEYKINRIEAPRWRNYLNE